MVANLCSSGATEKLHGEKLVDYKSTVKDSAGNEVAWTYLIENLNF